jgi:hypothetical protein
MISRVPSRLKILMSYNSIIPAFDMEYSMRNKPKSSLTAKIECAESVFLFLMH